MYYNVCFFNVDLRQIGKTSDPSTDYICLETNKNIGIKGIGVQLVMRLPIPT